MLPTKQWKAETLMWLLAHLFIALGVIGLIASLVDRWLAGPLLFSAQDVKDVPALVEKLRSRSDAVSAYLASRLSPRCMEMVDQFATDKSVATQLQSMLASELNKVISGPVIYDERRFAAVPLRPETKGLLEKWSGRLHSRRLNRLLLEDAYPEALAQTQLSDKEVRRRQVWLQVGFTPIFQVVTFFLVGAFLKKNDMSWTDAFGLGTKRFGRLMFTATFAVLFLLPVSLGLLWISRELMMMISVTPEVQTMVKALESARTWDQYVLLGVTAIFLAPAWEELVFRGILYSAVCQAGFPRLAWIGTSLLFAAVHVNLMTFLSLFTVGAVMVWLYRRTENLLAPILAHSLFNAVNFAWMIITGSPAN